MTKEHSTLKRIPANAYNDMFFDGDDIVVIDFDDLATACSLGVVRNNEGLPELATVYRGGCIIRNFPCIYIEDKHLVDYKFENCGEVHFINCGLRWCTISNVRAMFFTDSVVAKTEFRDLATEEDDDAIITLVSSNLYNCEFNDIVMQTDGYLCRFYEGSDVTDCTHVNCYSDRLDMELYDRID